MSTAVQRETTPAARTVTGGHLVARALKAEGIEAIFTLCGGHIIDIYDGCTDAGIRIIDVRHEQAAAHAADAWARLTGGPGCAVVTAGPGVTDTITAVTNAWRAQTPIRPALERARASGKPACVNVMIDPDVYSS